MDRAAPPPDDPAADPAPRRIIHVDMDAFFASVEQRDDPALRGRPVAVGGGAQRGVVAAASYEARRFGVRSAMPGATARRLCPDLVFVKPRFEVYKAVSQAIRAIFARHTPLVEPLSLDEAYLDVTDHLPPGQSATDLARAIRAAIAAETGLTASAGVSYNKFLAKLASDQNKPDGLFVIPPARGPDFVLTLPVGRFHGVGPATARRMEGFGIRTGADLRALGREVLDKRFGKAGGYYWNIARGIDHRPVRAHRIRKSVGAERTFAADVMTLETADAALAPLAEKVWSHASGAGVVGRTVTLKVKFSDFVQVTRARSLPRPVAAEAELLEIARVLARGPLPDPRGARLLGVTLSGLSSATPAPAADAAQLDLFDVPHEDTAEAEDPDLA